MAVAQFEHACGVSGRKTLREGKWSCVLCGEAARFAGVGHSMIENMAMYSRRYGLKPVGPHGRLVGTLLKDVATIRCGSCGGSGHRVVGGEDVVSCRACAGTGFAPECWEVIRRVRARVIEAYPDSATPFPPPTILIPAWLARGVGIRAGRVAVVVLAAVLVMLFLVLVLRADAAGD